MVLSKDLILFDRDEKGGLIPKEVKLVIDEDDENQLKYKDETIFIIPMTRGEIKKLFSDMSMNSKTDGDEKDLDADLIEKFCVNPKLTKEEIKYLKSEFSSIMVNTIMEHSGISSKKPKNIAIKETEDEFAKNSEELSQNEKKAI